MQLMRYLIVGVFNTLIGLSLIYGAMYFLHFDIVRANAFGYAIGILFSFYFNKKLTFKSDAHVVYSFVKFVLVLAVAYAANLYTVLFFNTYYHINPYAAQAAGVVPYTLIGFLGSRYFAFSGRNNPAQSEYLPLKNMDTPEAIIQRPIDLTLVVPCYNEEAVLNETTLQLSALMTNLVASNKISLASRVTFVDDGSSDRTWSLIESLAKQYKFVHGIKLSRNRGHQNALLAGLLTVDGEAVISVDADLQDDLSAIEKMINFYRGGYDIVYGIRDSRETDTFFKRLTAQGYYHLLIAMGVEIVFNHADYRLMSRKVIEALKKFDEVNLFLRGIIPQLGFSHAYVYYDRAERFAGESKYPLNKMLALAWQGITSFTFLPLRFITIIGFFVSLCSFAISVWAIVVRFTTDDAVPGWASTVLPIYFLGGIQLLCLGVMGEYLAKIYSETKRRPRFIIEKYTQAD